MTEHVQLFPRQVSRQTDGGFFRTDGVGNPPSETDRECRPQASARRRVGRQRSTSHPVDRASKNRALSTEIPGAGSRREAAGRGNYSSTVDPGLTISPGPVISPGETIL